MFEIEGFEVNIKTQLHLWRHRIGVSRAVRQLRAACRIALCALCAVVQPVAAANTLVWNTNFDTVSADIRNGDLHHVLGQIAGHTGWAVFVEPGAEHKVSTKFNSLPPGPALGRLLGGLSFAMVPGASNSPSKLYVFATAVGNATQAVRAIAPSATNIIANELVVRLKPGASIDDLARQFGAKVKGRLEGLNAYRLEFETAEAADSARKALAENSLVEAVDHNYGIQRPLEPGSLGGANLPPRAKLSMNPPPSNGRVVVGLIDTGVQSLGPDLDPFLLNQISVAGPSWVDPSEPSHGTSMAETLLKSLQYATDGSTSVQILPVDVYGRNPSTSTFDIANGIVQAINGGARIINMSLGSEANSPILRDIIKEATSRGIILFAAAGNTPVTTAFYPAAYPEVMAVTAVEHGQLAPYANRGDFVSLAAPGTSVIYYQDQPYYVVGTSAASAFATGAAAGYMEKTQSTPLQTREHVTTVFGINGSPNSNSGLPAGPTPRRR